MNGLDRNRAAEEFARMLFQVGIRGGITTFFESLNDPVGEHKERWQRAKSWYHNQPADVQDLIQFVLREAMVLAVFRISVRLDGAASYEEIDDHVGMFTVGLNIYENYEKLKNDTPDDVVAICPTKRGEDVHDIFLNLTDEN